MASHPELVLGANDDVRPAVLEVYEWLLSLYLPTRFPLMFKVLNPMPTDDAAKPPSLLQSLVTGECYPLEPPQSTIEALKIMGGLIDEDMLFMLPSPDADGYSLQGYVNCFANGPSTRERFSRKLRDIHSSIPGYREKLETGMDKWFEKLEVGAFVKRINVSAASIQILCTLQGRPGLRLTLFKWAITDNGELFSESIWIPFVNAEKDSTDIDIDHVRWTLLLSLLL